MTGRSIYDFKTLDTALRAVLGIIRDKRDFLAHRRNLLAEESTQCYEKEEVLEILDELSDDVDMLYAEMLDEEEDV